jgi:hypothetical protein
MQLLPMTAADPNVGIANIEIARTTSTLEPSISGFCWIATSRTTR